MLVLVLEQSISTSIHTSAKLSPGMGRLSSVQPLFSVSTEHTEVLAHSLAGATRINWLLISVNGQRQKNVLN